MSISSDPGPWLEMQDGTRFPVLNSSSIGRSDSNQIPLPDTKVSRRHAIVHAQNQDEFWLVDLGSSNGTYLNNRRVAQPTRLKDGDCIAIGDALLTFRQPGAKGNSETITDATICEIKTVPCWLLLADIINSTVLSGNLTAEKLSALTGSWIGDCKEAIERNHGSINKYLGDGILAYWTGVDRTKDVSTALLDLKKLQRGGSVEFRVVAHFGEVTIGGKATLGEESLMGRDVNFIFRMEKVAGTLRETCLLSEEAKSRLPASFGLRDIGQHELSGFNGRYHFYTY